MRKIKTAISVLLVMVILSGAICKGDVELLVSCEDTGQILRYDGKTGAFKGILASGLSRPYALTFGPDNSLYLSDNGIIKRYDQNSQTFINFALGGNEEMAWGPDGNLYVGGYGIDKIARYSGLTGEFIDDFVQSGSGGLSSTRAFCFGPDGNLYVGNRSSDDNILRYNGVTGEFMDEFVLAGNNGNLRDPLDMVFGPDNNLYVANRYGSNILRFDGMNGQFIDVFASEGLEYHPWGITFGPDGNLYVASHYQYSILRYNGINGNLIDQFVFSGSGGLNSPSQIVFTPIPEPCTLSLLALGAILAGKKRRMA